MLVSRRVDCRPRTDIHDGRKKVFLRVPAWSLIRPESTSPASMYPQTSINSYRPVYTYIYMYVYIYIYIYVYMTFEISVCVSYVYEHICA